MELLFVAAGGAVGAVLRFVVSNVANSWLGSNFTRGTIGVNLIGSFVIGFLWRWFEDVGVAPQMRTFVFIGILGGFTTFSSFTLDSLRAVSGGAGGGGYGECGGQQCVGINGRFSRFCPSPPVTQMKQLDV